MADLNAALEWAKQNPNDERSKKLLEAVLSGKINSDSVKAKQILEENSGATKGVFDAVNKGFSNIKEGIQKSGQELRSTLDSNAPTPLKVAKTATGLIKGVISPIAEAVVATPARVLGEVTQNVTGIDVNEAVAQGTQRLVQKGLNTEQAKKAMEGWSQLKETNPDAAMALSTVLDIGDIVSNVVGIKGATMAGEVGLKGAMKTAETVGKATGKAVDSVGDAGKYAVGQTFGLNKETVKNIIDNPKLFTKKEIEKIDRESIFTKARTALESRMEALSETGKEYDKIRKIPVKTSVSEQTVLDKLSEKGIDVKDGKISVNLGSEIQLSKADISGLEEVLGLLQGKTGLTPTEILNLRKRLSNLSGFAEGRTDASSKVAKEIRSTIDQIAKKEIPGLTEVDAKFSSERQFLDKVKGVMFDRKGNIKDNAISKIATLTGKGKEFMLERMEKVIPGITEDLNILKAIEDIDYAKSQKIGTYGRTLIGAGGGAAVGGPVGAILGAIATSPQVGVTLLRSYGKAKGIAKDVIESVVSKMKVGKKLLDNEKKIIDEAVNEAAKKAGSRVKEMGNKGGLSIQDVTKQPGYDPLLQEAGKYKSAEEFVNSKATVWRAGREYHPSRINPAEGVSFSYDKNVAQKFADMARVSGGNAVPRPFYIKPEAKILDMKNIPKEMWNSEYDMVAYAKKNGYDAIKIDQLGQYKESELRVVNPDVIVDRHQLTDLWGEANKKLSKNTERNIKVSDSNNELLKNHTFSLNADGYPVTNKGGKVVYLHDLVMGTEKAKGFDIDHINGNKLDNRVENLRVVTHQANGFNAGLSKNNTSGVKGVKWDGRINKWIASISPDGKTVHLGSFANIDDAVKARKAGEVKYTSHLYNKAHVVSPYKKTIGEVAKENIGIVKEGKKVKQKILNEMADFTSYASGELNFGEMSVNAEIRARKIAKQLGINPDISNSELSKKFGKILEKYDWSQKK